MDGEQVEAALSAARRGGLEPAVLHALDVGWLRRERPALLLTQDACLSCEAVAGTVHAALEAAGLERERALTLAPKSVDGMLRAMRTVGCVALRRLYPHVVEAAPACTTKVGTALGMADLEVEAVVGGLEARLAAVARAVEAVTPAAGALTSAPTAVRRPRLLGLESVCPSGCNRM